ncbi:P-loop NTPase fold protein [Mesorhizobium sp. WSM4898]|uniref:KAP family P-loop NTPase fold protein n=1 Tax=unclassified Mesorhizobium TaxID=325217 RepID=UPI0024151FF7|nr:MULTISPECIES: P-loop NTPase fold protein [unclassified Mesorhizobium]MDG4908747.1 P-loop NTPase fold protein [Mesorhizobium sp. WSM4898]
MSKLDEIWSRDLLNRRGDADFLEKFIAGQVRTRLQEGARGSFAINIDADWGAGKTFFVERLAQQLHNSGHVVARVNAWRDDYLDDPFVAVLAAIDEAIAPFVKKDSEIQSAWKGVKRGAVPVLGRVVSGVAKTVVRKYVGEEIDELLKSDPEIGGDADAPNLIGELVRSGTEKVTIEIESVIDQGTQKVIDQFNEKRKAADDFQTRLTNAVAAIGSERPLPFYVIVDELDRCRPSYAVALLERVKHLFGAPNIAFVFATNSDQLRHSIAGMYGAGFNGFKYLKRFFEITYQLSDPDISQFVAVNARTITDYHLRAPGDDVARFLHLTFDAYKLKARDIKRVLTLVENAAIAWPHKQAIDLSILLPLAISYYKDGDPSWRDALANIPDNLSIDIDGDRRYGNRPYTLNVENIFSRFVDINSDKVAFKSFMDRENNSMEDRYVLSIVNNDWDRVMNQGWRTVHDELVALVAHAGSIKPPSE